MEGKEAVSLDGVRSRLSLRIGRLCRDRHSVSGISVLDGIHVHPVVRGRGLADSAIVGVCAVLFVYLMVDEIVDVARKSLRSTAHMLFRVADALVSHVKGFVGVVKHRFVKLQEILRAFCVR